MSAAAKLTGFAALLLLTLAVSVAAGHAISPDKPSGLTGSDNAEDSDAMAMGGGEHAAAAHEVRGLAVADDGVRLVVDKQELRRGAALRRPPVGRRRRLSDPDRPGERDHR